MSHITNDSLGPDDSRDSDTKEEVRQRDGEEGEDTGHALSTFRHVFVASAAKDGKIAIWNVRKGVLAYQVS